LSIEVLCLCARVLSSSGIFLNFTFSIRGLHFRFYPYPLRYVLSRGF
jgi:hypothetical protein